MKISPQTLPNVTAARQTLPDAWQTAPRNEKADAVKADPTAVRATPPVFSPLSPETNWSLVEATQQEPAPSEHAGKSPAHAARALIEERPDLADLPFGKVVSMLARGLTPPPAPAEDEAELPPTPESTSDVDLPPAEAQAPETVEGPGGPEAPPPAPAGEDLPDSAELAVSLLDDLSDEADNAPAPDLVSLAAQGLAPPPEVDPTDLLDPA